MPVSVPIPTNRHIPPSGTLNPYELCFIKGNISTCMGCHNRYPKSPQAPNDLCIKHKEWQQFNPQGTDTPQSKFSNVYYHCKPECVWLRCPDFNPVELDALRSGSSYFWSTRLICHHSLECTCLKLADALVDVTCAHYVQSFAQ